jgi:acetyl-CoA acetyltransferase
MQNVYANARIVGVGTTKQARSLAPRTSFSVALEALNLALDDAGMTIHDLDGFSSYLPDWPMHDWEWSYQLKKNLKWAGRGIDPRAVMEAAAQVSSGRCKAIAIVSGGVRPTTATVAPWTDHDSQWTAWTGSLPDQPVQFGLVAQRYLHEVGPRALDAMAAVAASTRNFGSINPDAVFFGKGPFTAQDVLSARTIAGPLTLLMCSVVSDGGAAIIITHKDRATDTGKRGVLVATGDSAMHYAPYHQPPHLDGYYEMTQPYRDTLKVSGIRPQDIDHISFYDHFASHCLMQYEMFGLCGKGEGADFALGGEMTLSGRWPTCTDGGNLSYSHPGAPNIFRYIEAIRQIRGEVKDLCPQWESGVHTYDPAICRSVKGANTSLVSAAGTPTMQGSFVVLSGD